MKTSEELDWCLLPGKGAAEATLGVARDIVFIFPVGLYSLDLGGEETGGALVSIASAARDLEKRRIAKK